MSKISEFFKRNIAAVKWSAWYIFIMWAILQGMFNFCMFSISDWSKLIHAELHGFAGFVFGILILAALPLYIATTVLVVRNNAPVINPDLSKIPILPKLLKLFSPTVDAPSTDTEPTAPEIAASDNDKADELDGAPLPAGLPTELHALFLRARNHIGRPQTSQFDMTHLNIGAGAAPVAAQPVPVAADMGTNSPAVNKMVENTTPTNSNATDDFPLPDNFDMGDATDSPFGIGNGNGAPTFTEINFDEPTTNNTPDKTKNTAIYQAPTPQKLLDYLNAKSIAHEMDGDIVITPEFAIASHTDTDFWIADDDTWFAAGFTRPSPVATVIDAAKQRGLRPALYLESTNILDSDNRIAIWRTQGITVITDLNELK